MVQIEKNEQESWAWFLVYVCMYGIHVFAALNEKAGETLYNHPLAEGH